MPVKCWTRKENHGLHTIFPLQGKKKHNSLLVNDSVRFVYDRIVAGVGIAALSDDFFEYVAIQPPKLSEGEDAAPINRTQVRFDLYRILVLLRDHDICNSEYTELMSLLPPGRVLRGRTQVCPPSQMDDVSQLLQDAYQKVEGLTIFFAAPHPAALTVDHFFLEQVCRRHFDQQEIFFCAVDKEGRIEAISGVRGFSAQTQGLNFSWVMGRNDGKRPFIEIVGAHLAQLCGLLSVVTLAPKIRFYSESVQPGTLNKHTLIHQEFMPLIGEVGFRKSFTLDKEFDDDTALVSYEKVLF